MGEGGRHMEARVCFAGKPKFCGARGMWDGEPINMM